MKLRLLEAIHKRTLGHMGKALQTRRTLARQRENEELHQATVPGEVGLPMRQRATPRLAMLSLQTLHMGMGHLTKILAIHLGMLRQQREGEGAPRGATPAEGVLTDPVAASFLTFLSLRVLDLRILTTRSALLTRICPGRRRAKEETSIHRSSRRQPMERLSPRLFPRRWCRFNMA